MKFSIAMTGDLNDELQNHLLRKDGQEDVCFALWRPSSGHSRLTALLCAAILPFDDERNVHGNASFEPAYLLRAMDAAAKAGAGLALLHSHPLGVGWQRMSDDDVAAEQGNAGATLAVTGLPLVGMTLAGDRSWTARLWPKQAPRSFRREACENVRVVGSRLGLTWNPALLPVPAVSGRLATTVSAWGATVQADLARLRIGVVGLGSVGSMVAENLARIGVNRLVLLDFDTLKEHNLDRCLHATAGDVGAAKVTVSRRGVLASATASHIDVVAEELSICEGDGFRLALDCDVLFSCVDRPWPRQVLNLAAYAHLIPVVDGGVDVDAGAHGLHGARWKAHVVGFGRRCLECLQQYDPGLVQTEREGYLDDPSYLNNLPEYDPLRHGVNVFPFSMSAASFEVLQFLRMVIAPLGVADVGGDDYQFVIGRHSRDEALCRANCTYSSELIAQGDHVGYVLTGRHRVAEEARASRAAVADG